MREITTVPRRKLSFLEITLRLSPMYAMFALTGLDGYVTPGSTRWLPWIILGELILGGLAVWVILRELKRK